MTNMKAKLLANMAILTTITFWGVSSSIVKIALREVPPSTLALIRFIIASVILHTITKILYPNIQLEKKDRKGLILCGLIGVTVYFIFENYGLSMINAANATIILASIPLFTIAMERIVYKTPIGMKKGIGVVMSMVGVILVIGNSISVNAELKEITGSLLMLGAAISWAIYSFLNRPLEGKYPIIFLTAHQSFYGGLFLIPFALLERKGWGPISLTSWLCILYLALFCSALCYYLYLFALKSLGATQTNVYINLMPFIGVFAAYFILGERLYMLQLLGGIVVLAGIYTVNRSKSNTVRQSPDQNKTISDTV